MSKHFRHIELKPELEETVWGCYAPGELIEADGQYVCAQCGRVGNLWVGWCRICADEE
jgi:hypothetical protein